MLLPANKQNTDDKKAPKLAEHHTTARAIKVEWFLEGSVKIWILIKKTAPVGSAMRQIGVFLEDRRHAAMRYQGQEYLPQRSSYTELLLEGILQYS